MNYIMKKMRYGLFVLGFILSSSVNLLATFELSEEQVAELDLQIHGIALFSGTDPFSMGIKIATESHYSHAGIMLYDVKGDPDDESSWYCFESTGGAGEVLKGILPHVRLTPWADVVKNYSGGVASRFLNVPEEEQPDATIVTNFIRENNQKSYETDLFELLASLSDGNDKPDMETVFCSELAAALMQKLGMIDSEISSNNYLPSEFSVDKENLPFINGYFLQEENIVKAYKLKRLTRFGIWFRHNIAERIFPCLRRQGHSA